VLRVPAVGYSLLIHPRGAVVGACQGHRIFQSSRMFKLDISLEQVVESCGNYILSQGRTIWEIIQEAYVIPDTLDHATQGELQRYENN
jgi:5-methylcytosine-specific restriction endonuclease McrBC regulatory subunit McrC